MRKAVTIMLALIVTTAGITSCGNIKDKPDEMNLARVHRGNLDITVSSDGNLAMPRQVELGFGTVGAVTEVLVKEGETVKEGTLLARLDNTLQKNAIKTALYDMQLARNDLAESASSCRRREVYPYNYPNASAIYIFNEAVDDMAACKDLLEQRHYKEAAAKLRMAYLEIEVCMELLNAMVRNDETYLGLPTTPTYEEKPDLPDTELSFLDTTKIIDRLQQNQKDLAEIHNLIKVGAYDESATALAKAQRQLITSQQAVKSIPGQKIRFSLSYPDTAAGIHFVQSASRSLTEMRERMEQDDYNAMEFAEMLSLAQVDLQISQYIIENNLLLFESGWNLREVQEYNLNLQQVALDLQKAKRTIADTEILAPFDGTVVDVSVAIADVLSAQDYSARTAVTLVDTSSIEFEGIVDEVDIFEVRVGQKATVTIDAYPDERFTGIVKFISPFGVAEESGVISFAVTIELDPTEIELEGGLTATADIQVIYKDNVLLIPTEAIITTPMGNIAAVVDETTAQIERRHIEIGAKSYEFAEVISGIEEGEMVLLIDEEAVEAGRSQVESQGGRPPGRPSGRQFLR